MHWLSHSLSLFRLTVMHRFFCMVFCCHCGSRWPPVVGYVLNFGIIPSCIGDGVWQLRLTKTDRPRKINCESVHIYSCWVHSATLQLWVTIWTTRRWHTSSQSQIRLSFSGPNSLTTMMSFACTTSSENSHSLKWIQIKTCDWWTFISFFLCFSVNSA